MRDFAIVGLAVAAMAMLNSSEDVVSFAQERTVERSADSVGRMLASYYDSLYGLCYDYTTRQSFSTTE